MNEERLLKIEKIYHDVLDVPAEKRSSYLADICSGDSELLSEVESLLSFAETESSLIDKPPMDVAAEMLSKNEHSEIIGREIGQYKIIKHLGTGGMGEVFLAEDSKLERFTAIKFIKAAIAKMPDQLSRFLQEAKTASALNHPNIITIYEIGELDHTHFIATEYIEGKTLRKVMSDDPPSISETLDIISQVATAANAAHSAGIVHRDIKPENIILREDGLVKVLDFGLAKLQDVEIGSREKEGKESTNSSIRSPLGSSQSHTIPGLMMGTVAYMSPEQARIEKIDGRSDIWSIGVVLYEMLAGTKPFIGDNAEEKIESILKQNPKPLGEDIPLEVRQIVEKALQKDANYRFQNAQELLQAMENVSKEFIDESKSINKILSLKNKQITSPNESRVSSPDHLQERAESNSYSNTQTVFNTARQYKFFTGSAFLVFIVAIAIGGYFYSMTSSETVIDNSVAVLPFVNQSGDSEIDYLSDGISESIINSLSQLSGVKVIAKNSSFEYRGKEFDSDEIAKKLGVKFILRGHIQQNGDDYKVVTELIDLSDKRKIWGEEFTRKLADVLNLENEISKKIATQMQIHLTNTEEKKLAKVRKIDPKAYEMLQKGRFYQAKSGKENSEKALEYYNQALEIDPNYANAYAAISDSYFYLGVNSYLNPKDALPKAKETAQRALEINENLAESHYTLARIKTTEWNWLDAEREYKRAIELNPNLASVFGGFAFFLSTQGRHEEAINLMKRARELDPLRQHIYPDTAYIYFLARQYDLAEEQYEHGQELNPNNVGILNGFGFMAAARKDYAEAIEYYQKVLKAVGGKHTGVKCYLGFALAKSGEMREAKAILNDLETGEEYISPVELAMLYIGLGENDMAIASLEKGYKAHDSQLQFLGVEPHFDDLRKDPRFIELMERVGLSPSNYKQ